VDVTQVIRRRSRGAALPAPSLRAQILLVLSAFLCGTVLASLLFVGVWRHTADDGARAQRAQRLAERRLTSLTAQLERTRSLLAARTDEANRSRTALRKQVATNATISGRLAGAAASARSLQAQLSTIESELRSLQAYVQHPGPAGLDAGYLAAQLRYLRSSAAAH
jgi:septal ring factor EnvC (AmiA/AmiB activator)